MARAKPAVRQEWFALSEVCGMFNISIGTCRRLISEGHLKAVKLPGMNEMRVSRKAITEWVKEGERLEAVDES
ncbi:MAG: helix-turn-helix domain-containing protein [Atopobiaceae bacterium]|nr:helix-turn-helix domain-containing protein [Atopobiaceae bacterium]